MGYWSDYFGDSNPFSWAAGKVGDFFGGLADNLSGRQGERQFEEQMAFEREKYEYQKQMEQTQMQREDTAYQRAASDMRSAGLNPLTGVNPSQAQGTGVSAGNASPTASNSNNVLGLIMSLVTKKMDLKQSSSIALQQLKEQNRHNAAMETLTSQLGNRNATIGERNATSGERGVAVQEQRAQSQGAVDAATVKKIVEETVAEQRHNDYYSSGLGKGLDESSSSVVKEAKEASNAVQAALQEAQDTSKKNEQLQRNARNAWIHQSGTAKSPWVGKFQYFMLGSPVGDVKVTSKKPTLRFFPDENVWKVYTADGWKRASPEDFRP